MRKSFLALLAVCAALFVVPSASAVKFGTPDTTNAYPWVGLMVAVDSQGEPLWRCTGSLLSTVKPVESGIKQRMIGTVSLVNLRSALTDGWNVHYSNNPGQGHGGSGGTCFGDSGGPVLYNGLIVAVNSFVLNNNCNGAGFGYRVDTSLARTFIFGPHPAT
jgi:Trypsin